MLVVIIIVHVVNIFSVSFKHQTCQPQHTHPRNVPLPCPAAPLTPRPIHFELVGRAPWTLERASTRGFRVNSRMGRQAGMTKPTCGGLCPRGEGVLCLRTACASLSRVCPPPHPDRCPTRSSKPSCQVMRTARSAYPLSWTTCGSCSRQGSTRTWTRLASCQSCRSVRRAATLPLVGRSPPPGGEAPSNVDLVMSVCIHPKP